MVSEQWFDRWQRSLGSQARRGFLRTAVALIVTFPISKASQQGAAHGKRQKGKHKHHHNRHGKPGSQSPRRCGEAECALEWPADFINRNECELKCGRCRLSEKFCIVEGDPALPDHVATCCFENQTCCPDANSATGHLCVDTKNTSDHCGRCNFPCPPGLICVGSRCVCPDDRRLCVDGCVDTQTDPRNCRECGTVCPTNGRVAAPIASTPASTRTTAAIAVTNVPSLKSFPANAATGSVQTPPPISKTAVAVASRVRRIAPAVVAFVMTRRISAVVRTASTSVAPTLSVVRTI